VELAVALNWLEFWGNAGWIQKALLGRGVRCGEGITLPTGLGMGLGRGLCPLPRKK